MWNGEIGKSLNTVSARVVAGGVGMVWTGVGAASPISVSRSGGVKVMVAQANVSPVAAVLNTEGRISRGPEATIDRCSNHESNCCSALMVRYAMYTLEGLHRVGVRAVLNRLHSGYQM